MKIQNVQVLLLYNCKDLKTKYNMAGNLNSGRKNKSDEIAMIEKLSPLDDIAFKQLKKGIERGEFAYVKLYFLYRWGKPKQIQEITVNSDQPLFDLSQVPNVIFKKTE